VGRSVSGGSANIGWKAESGSVNDDNNPYSMNVAARGLGFTELLFGSYTSAKNWGANAYVHDLAVPADFLNAQGSSTIDTNSDGLTAVLGSCSPFSYGMFRYVGNTYASDRFHFKDITSGGSGLYADGWDLYYGPGSANNMFCTWAGEVHGLQGMIFVR
jgi:hypothetical protein